MKLTPLRAHAVDFLIALLRSLCLIVKPITRCIVWGEGGHPKYTPSGSPSSLSFRGPGSMLAVGTPIWVLPLPKPSTTRPSRMIGVLSRYAGGTCTHTLLA